MGTKSLWTVKIGCIDIKSDVMVWEYIGVWGKDDDNEIGDVVGATGKIAKEYKTKGLTISKIEIQPTGISRIWEEPKEDTGD